MRSFDQVTLICNQKDYLSKVMPATTVLNAAGAFTSNIFPFPTEIRVTPYCRIIRFTVSFAAAIFFSFVGAVG